MIVCGLCSLFFRTFFALKLMARHLKSIVKNRLKCAVAYYAPHSEISASHRRGVRYLVPVVGIDMLWGAMNTHKEGRHYHKHIIVRRIPRSGGQLLQLYTYRFPKTWSAACVANRELIKEAQRRAHALEKDFSPVGMEWRIRFFKHYFRVFKGGEKPEKGFKAYSRFYQYTYVAIYRQLKEEAQKAKEEEVEIEDITFEPIDFQPRLQAFSSPLRRAYNCFQNTNLQPPDIQGVTNPPKIPRTTDKFVYVEEKQ